MRRQCEQSNSLQRLVNNGPLVVFGNGKKRDAPVIYHRRDGPILDTGPPVGTGPPGGVGPPRIQGNWPETISRKNAINGNALVLKWFGTSEERNNINLNKRKTKMKNFKLKRLLGLAFIGGLAALNASTALAAAGDPILNRATLNFNVGASAFLLESSPAGKSTTGATNGADTSFVEDRLINFTVAETSLATQTVTAGELAQVQTFTVTNNGNAPQDFLLTALERANGTADPFGGVVDSFAPTNVQVFVETVNAGYVAADDTNIFIDELGAGLSATVYIVADIPAVADGSLAVMTLVAQVAAGGGVAAQGAAITNDDNGHISPAGTYSNGATSVVAGAASTIADDPATMQTVFGDAAGDLNSTAAAGAASNGQHADSDSYTVQAAALSLQKTAAILWDPVNGNVSPKAITGAYTTYTIVITNTGTASGDLTTLGDTLSASLALDPDFVTNAGPGNPTNAAGASFDVAHGGGSTRADPVSCTAGADADGCDAGLAAGGAISIDFTVLMPVEGAYTAGELKPGETVTIVFNTIVQ